MRVLRSLSVLAVLVPGLLAAPALTPLAAAAAEPVPPAVQELTVSGVDETAAQSSSPSGVTGALVTSSERRTVLLTDLLDTQPYAVVGVTWTADPEVGEVESWVRTRTAGTWSEWQALGGTADEQPDAATSDTGAALRGGTSPLWVGEADGVQARVDVLSGADPRDLRVSLVDPGESPADATAGTALGTSATAAAPTILSRADWGADESIRRAAPAYASGIHAVTVHHTASSNDYAAADVPRLLRGFYAYHVKSNGWSDLGYNFVVDRFGRIWEGRAGGTSKPVIGSHAGGFNTGTVGISMIGTYESVVPAAAMTESVARLAAWRLDLAGKDPEGTVRVTSGGSTRFAKGTVVTLPRIFGHREVSTTACPGIKGMAALPGIRSRAGDLAGGTAPTQPAPVTGPFEVVAPATVAQGASVPVTVEGGRPGSAVQVWFGKRGQSGFTSRRDGVFSSTGTYSTGYVADDDYTLFAMSDGVLTPRHTVKLTTPLTTAPTGQPTGMTVRGPVTVAGGGSVVVTATGPAGAPVSLWLRPQGATAFTRATTGVFDGTGTWVTSYTNAAATQYFAMSSGLTSHDGSTLLGPVPNGLDITAPAQVSPGAAVPLVVQGTPGQRVEVWFSRRGEGSFSRRREAVLAADGTYRTHYIAHEEHTYFAVSGGQTSKRVLTRLTSLPPLGTYPAPPVAISAPKTVDTGQGVAVTVTGPAGAPLDVWFRRRGNEVWHRLREGVFDAAGRWSTTYVGNDDHEYWASSQGLTSYDASTLTVPVLRGPSSAPLGARVELTGRARPGDTVVVESRRRGQAEFVRSTLTADASGTFATAYSADDEYEYRALVDTRTGTLRRTTVAPTVEAPDVVRRGSTVTLRGTARPGATVEVLFRRDGRPSLAVGGRRYRNLPVYAVGRTATAGPDGRWSTSFAPTSRTRWYVRSDGNRSRVRSTAVQ